MRTLHPLWFAWISPSGHKSFRTHKVAWQMLGTFAIQLSIAEMVLYSGKRCCSKVLFRGMGKSVDEAFLQKRSNNIAVRKLIAGNGRGAHRWGRVSLKSITGQKHIKSILHEFRSPQKVNYTDTTSKIVHSHERQIIEIGLVLKSSQVKS